MIDNLSFQIRYLGQKTNTQFIFIAPSKSKRGGMAKWYTHLSKFVQETDHYIRLARSTDLGNSISMQYKKLKSIVKVTHSTHQNVEVKLESDCEVKTEQDNIHICSNVEGGKTLNFKATINVDKKFCKEDLNTTVEIKLEGTESKMILNIECGKCECEWGYIGEFCTCERNCPYANPYGDPDGKVGECSGRGICNKCSANKVSGCTCDAGWTGDDCSVKAVGASFSIPTYPTVEGKFLCFHGQN